jgi:Glycosyl transferase family 90
MAQPSTYTSWAMEELLEPWVHYIPLNDDLSDVEEKMQWVLDNDEAAKQIAHSGTLWISDMIFHPDAQHDDELIFDGTFSRYRTHFSLNNNLII